MKHSPADERHERKRRRRSSGTETTNDTAQVSSSSSSSMLAYYAVPWALVVGVAVAAAAYNSSSSTSSSSLPYENDKSGSSDLNSHQNYWSSSGILRVLTTDAAGETDSYYHQHHHHEIISEEHDPLFPLTQNDFIGFGLAVLGLMVAAGGGIGGGGILVPIYILVMGFGPKHAIPLSNVTVLGGAIANTILNVRKRHPLADRPLVDWDLILVMEPLTIAGALAGAFLNKVLPVTLLVVLLVALLSFTAYTSLRKATKMYRKETQFFLQEAHESELTRMAHKQATETQEEAADTLLDHMEQADDDDDDDEDNDDDDDDDDNAESTTEHVPLQKMQVTQHQELLDEERVTPMLNIWILVTLFVVVLSVNLLKGGGAFPSPVGIKCGSISFWMANLFMLGWIVLVSLFVRSYLVRRHEVKKECNFPYVEGDIEWDGRATIVYPCICCFAGFFAGMFGIGGGIVKGPLMLAMGVHPAVGSATSASMILFTSFTATTSFVVFGLLLPDYAPVCLVVGFVATLAGQLGLSYLMRKAQRNSYIAFSIGGVVLLSAFLMTIQSLLSLASGEKHHAGGICGKGD